MYISVSAFVKMDVKRSFLATPNSYVPSSRLESQMYLAFNEIKFKNNYDLPPVYIFTRKMYIYWSKEMLFLYIFGAVFFQSCFAQKRQKAKNFSVHRINRENICLLKVNNIDTKAERKLCSKSTIKRPEQRQWRLSDMFIIYFGHISQLSEMFLLLNLNS